MIQKLTSLRDIHQFSRYDWTKRNRIDDLYTNGTEMSLLDYESIPFQTKILNNININVEDEMTDEERIRLIFCDTGDSFKFIASCDDGCTIGNFYEGKVCPTCKTVVKTITSDVLKFRAMFRIPTEFPAILHPQAWEAFDHWLGIKNKNRLMESILLKRKNFPIELKEAGFKFGLKFFYENFDKYIEFFMTKSKFVTSDIIKKGAKIPEFIDKYRNVLFIRNIPILNSTLHVITSQKGTDKKYTDSQAGLIMLMYRTLKYVEQNRLIGRKVDVDLSMQKLAMTYYRYVNEIIKKKCSGKKGFVQQNIMAGRFHNTFRGTITPITVEHDGDELHVPWSIGVRCHKLEILNLLRNRFGHSFKEANERYYKAVSKYDSVVHQILKILIDECPYKGLPVLWDRNPSMAPGAMQLLFITLFKSDVDDKTIGMSQMIVKSPNADYKKKHLKIIWSVNQ